jgi:DNA modification methylase
MPFIHPDLITVPEDRGREDFSAVDEIAQSISELGQLHPILVEELPVEKNKFVNLRLLAGETRLRACKKLNREVWYVTSKAGKIDSNTELQRTRIEAMENLGRKDLTIHERNKLIDKIDRLMKEEYGRSLGGRYQKEEDIEKWNTEKTAKMLGFKSKATVSAATKMIRVANAVPEIKVAKTAAEQRQILTSAIKEEARQELLRRSRERITTENYGKISPNNGISTPKNLEQWAAGKLFCGDSRDLLKKIPPSSVDIWLTDPPYAVKFKRQDPKINTVSKNLTNTLYEDEEEDMTQILLDCIPLIVKASKPRSYVFWFCSFVNWLPFKELFESNGFSVYKKPLIWVQTDSDNKPIFGNCPLPGMWPASNTDCCLFAHRQGHLAKQGRPDVVLLPPVPPIQKEHAVEKPIELMLWLLEFVSIDAIPSFIADPFMGSGTSLVAALKMNPNNQIIGFDMNPTCIHIAKTRLIAEKMKILKGNKNESA